MERKRSEKRHPRGDRTEERKKEATRVGSCPGEQGHSGKNPLRTFLRTIKLISYFCVCIGSSWASYQFTNKIILSGKNKIGGKS